MILELERDTLKHQLEESQSRYADMEQHFGEAKLRNRKFEAIEAENHLVIDQQKRDIEDLKKRLEGLQSTISTLDSEKTAAGSQVAELKLRLQEYEQNETQLEQGEQSSKTNAGSTASSSSNNAPDLRLLPPDDTTGWVDGIQCQSCGSAFSFSNRKHHCRACGQIFCSQCCNKKTAVLGHKHPVLVCNSCHDARQKLRATTPAAGQNKPRKGRLFAISEQEDLNE